MANTRSELPGDFREDLLLANLAALQRSDPGLAERITWPVASDHLSFDGSGAHYRLHRGEFRLDLAPAEVESALAPLEEAAFALHFGIGCGELLVAGLEAGEATRHTAWERDPWLLRLFLGRFDVRAELASGRLRLALGVDLLRHARTPRVDLLHPRLAEVYGEERAVLAAPLPPRRVALVTGGLFIEPLARAFAARGFGVWPLAVRTQSPEELDHTLRQLTPELVVGVNHVEGLSEFCAERGIDLAVWEVDPAGAPPHPVQHDTSRTFVFAHRRAGRDDFRSAGYRNASYLPLAADPELRHPSPECERDVPLSFVGSSLAENAARLQAGFVQQWAHWRGGVEGAEEEASALATEIVRAQAEAPERFIVPELLAARAPEFMAAHARGELGVEDPSILIGERAAAEHRASSLRALAHLGPHVWGDDGWRELTAHGVRYSGPAGHREGLTAVYGRSRLNLDIGRLYQADIVTMRVFDVLATGSYVLAAGSKELDELFVPGVEVESWRSREELVHLAERALAEPDRCAEIARRGREAVLRYHTVEHRVDAMLAALAGTPPGPVRPAPAATLNP